MQNNRKVNIFQMYKEENTLVILDRSGFLVGCTDLDEYERVKKYYWVRAKSGYIINWRTKVKLHNFIMNIDNHCFTAEVDHINQDKTDNRKRNLRIVNRQINNFNRGLNKNNSSGYKGVSWIERLRKWRAYIMLDKKQINLGLFYSKEEAYKVRLEKENEIMEKLLEDYYE